jgi:hypothetical protein
LGLVAAGAGGQRREWASWVGCGHARTALARLAGSAAAVWAVGALVWHTPGLMWPLAGGWLVAVWRRGREIERQQDAEAAFVQFLRDRIGDRNGVLLAELLAGLHAAEMHLDWDVTALRRVVERLGIHVRDKIKVSGDTSVGVHVDDLTHVWDVGVTPPPPPSGGPSREAVSRDNYPTTLADSPAPAPSEKGMMIKTPESSVTDEEAERLRLQDYVNRVDAAKQAAFEEHFTDALGILDDQAS